MNDKQLWLITYRCEKSAPYWSEQVWRGTLGKWRIHMLQFTDGPYILINAVPLNPSEYKQLDGVIE